MALLWSAATSLPYDTMARCNWVGVMVLSPLINWPAAELRLTRATAPAGIVFFGRLVFAFMESAMLP